MKAFLIGSLVASTFLSPVAQASVNAGSAQLYHTAESDGTADFQRREGRRGGENPGARQSSGGNQLRGGRDGAGERDNQGDSRADRGGDNDGRGGWRRQEYAGQNHRSQEYRRQNNDDRDNRGGWQQPNRQTQQPVERPIERRNERAGGVEQPRPNWHGGQRDDRRGNEGRVDNRGIQNNQGNRDADRRQDRRDRDQNWDDRYDNGFDRERGTWDHNDRGHNDRYGNGWDRNEGRWNERRDDRRDNWRDDRRDDHRRDNHNSWNNDRRDDNRWDNSWRNDRRYDWRGHRSQYRDQYRRPGHYYAPDRHHRYSRFSIGLYIGSGFYHQDYWLNDPWQYRLPPVHGPYRWVRYYDDVLLIDVRNGYVVDVINDFFW